MECEPSHLQAANNTAGTRAPLSILLVYDCIYPHSIGGVEHRNYELARALGRRGHRVTLGGWTTRSRRIDANVDVVALRFAAPIYGRNGKRSATPSLRYAIACMLLPLRDYDVVETANIPYIHLFPLALRCWIARRKLVVTWHEYWGNYWRQYVGRLRAPVFAAVERATAQLGASVVAVSQLTATRLQTGRRGSGPIHTVPCGLDLSRIRAAMAAVTRQENSLIYAGRLSVDKRLHLVIQAVKLLTTQDTDLKLRIVGEGPERAALQHLTMQLGLQGRVEFTGRLESPDEVWRQIAGARVAVTASSREGFGMFPLESIACGTPVVYCASSESALPEILGNGRGGFMADASAEALAQQIGRLLQDRNLWAQASANGTREVEKYSWERIAEQTESVLYETVQPSRGHNRRRSLI